jgi:hypothetical protein
MHFDTTDQLNESQSQQSLQSVMSVWIKMIQRGKAVALPDDVCKISYDDSDWQQDVNGRGRRSKTTARPFYTCPYDRRAPP